MRERDANDGTKLHALIASMLAGESFFKTISRFAEQSGQGWEDMAHDLKVMMADAAREQIAKRKDSENGKDGT